MTLDIKQGDLVRHSRIGPAKVIEVSPDHITIAPRGREAQKLTLEEVEKQVLPVPSDGFCALLYHQEVKSDYLRDHIEDVVLRIMRDRRRQSARCLS